VEVSGKGAEALGGTMDGAPLFIFKGDAWTRLPELATLQSLVLDVFGARAVEEVTLKNLDHVSVLTAVERETGGASSSSSNGPNVNWGGEIHWRTYSVRLAVVSGGVPRAELGASYPRFDFTLRRAQLASKTLNSAAMKKPVGYVFLSWRPHEFTLALSPSLTLHEMLAPSLYGNPHPPSSFCWRRIKEKKIKNVTKDELGATLGRVHMERQDLAGLQLKKTPALKAELRERKRALKAGGAEEDEIEGLQLGEGVGGGERGSKKLKI